MVEKGQEEEKKTLKDPEITKMGKKVKSRFFDSYHSESISNIKRNRYNHSESSFKNKYLSTKPTSSKSKI